MIKKWRRATGLFLCALAGVMWISTEADAARRHQQYSTEQIYEVIDEALDWKRKDLKIGEKEGILDSSILEEAGSISGDGYPFCLARLGVDEDYIAYQAAVTRRVEQAYRTSQKLSKTNATEWHRIALSMLACGEDPTRVGEKESDLIRDGVYDRAKTAALDAEGVQGAAFGLITLDSMRYLVPEKSSYTRNDIVIMILEHQMPDGGFSADDTGSDAVTTSLVLTALAPYENSSEGYHYTIESTGEMGTKTVSEVIEAGLRCLEKLPLTDTESVSSEITALSALGMDAQKEEAFIDRRYTLIDELMAHRKEDGGFVLTDVESEEADSLSTEQAIRALTAYVRQQERMRSLYDFRPEQETQLHEQITQLNKDIMALRTAEVTTEQVEALYQRYRQIPVEERSYVYDFPELRKNMQDFGLLDDSEHLSEYMGICTGGAPQVINMRNSNEVWDTRALFTKKEERMAERLVRSVSVEKKKDLQKLLYEIRASKKDYSELTDQLLKAQEEIEGKEKEIASLNELIGKHLYPFDRISIGDKALIDDLMKRCDELTEHEKGMVTYYIELKKSQEKLQKEMKTMTLFGVISAIVLFSTVILIIFAKIRKQKRA